jgi:hypothetical protein
MVAQYAPVSEAASELLTFWILSTWLGSCVFDAPELQERLIALLTPYECQQTAERADSFEGLTIEAVLTLCHVGKTQAYAREIADEVNRIQEQRGEALRLSPAKVGHKLKKLGLFSRRLDQGGNGLILDLATRERVHQAAATYIGMTGPKMAKHLDARCASPRKRRIRSFRRVPSTGGKPRPDPQSAPPAIHTRLLGGDGVGNRGSAPWQSKTISRLASERLGERAWKLRFKPLGSIGQERLECALRFKDRPSFFILCRGPAVCSNASADSRRGGVFRRLSTGQFCSGSMFC